MGKCDLVIADLPCSGLGIIGRKPDIKYNASPDKLKELVKIQRNILSTVVKYLKESAILVYSTCTINKAENEEQVEYIKKLGFSILDKKQLIPGKDKDTDGFFYAVLRKN